MFESILLGFTKSLTFFVIIGFPVIILSILVIAMVSIIKEEMDEKN